jgi:predicted DCC family thiol-disulfide oxidoreductase YuxK
VETVEHIANEGTKVFGCEIKLLYDGACPVCKREAAFLRWLDGGRRKLLFEDIASPDFDPSRYGLTFQQAMGRIHGVLPDGRVLEGLAVFRHAYDAVGMGWLLAPTNWPILRRFFDAGYDWFARNRLRLTGRGGECHTQRCHTGHEPAQRILRIPRAARRRLG